MTMCRRTQVFKPANRSSGGMVVAQSSRAAEIGAEVLRAGGNAADAAVATAFALTVCEPWMSGPGGGGMALYHEAGSGRIWAIDFGLRAPQRLDLADYPLDDGLGNEMFPWRRVQGDRNTFGASSVAVPTHVAGIGALHDRFGRMPWAELVQIAASEARRGMVVDWFSAMITGSHMARIQSDPVLSVVFLAQGLPPSTDYLETPDARLPMPGLGATLDRLAEAGWQDFYRGDIAKSVAADLAALGSRIDLDDLAATEATVAEAGTCHFRGARVALAPGLSAGKTLGRTLDLFAPASDGDWFPAMARALWVAQSERWASDGDSRPASKDAKDCTTHFATSDREGNLCSVTQTILSVFGAGVALPGTGIILNNGLLWFDPEPGRPNSLGPGKRCLMNICPTILAEPDRISAIGAAGGRKILSSVSQIVGMLADKRMTPEDAIHAPRIDCSTEGLALVDPRLDTPDSAFAPTQVLREAPTFWPIPYSIPGILTLGSGSATGCADPMTPWADAIAE